jgi:hypothetical protein
VPCHVPLLIVPTEVRLELVTPDASAEPESVPAEAGTVQVDPRVHPTPLTVVAGLASALLGIAEADTAKDGVVVLFVTVGVNHDGQLTDGAEKLDTLPPVPAHHVGAAPTTPVPVSQRKRLLVVVLGPSSSVWPFALW